MKEKENHINFTFVVYNVRFEKFAITRGNHYEKDKVSLIIIRQPD